MRAKGKYWAGPSLERLGVFQLYLSKTKFYNKYQVLQHKARLVVDGHVVDSTEHITYSSTTKNVSTRLMILIDVKNGLGIMAGYIGNELCMAPCAENIWSCCGALVVLKRDLYGLNMASNSLHKYF